MMAACSLNCLTQTEGHYVSKSMSKMFYSNQKGASFMNQNVYNTVFNKYSIAKVFAQWQIHCKL